MKSEPRDQEFLTRYLLGELSEEEAMELEQACLDDDELFERVEAIQAGLTDEYVRGELSGRKLDRFERNLLNGPGRAEDVELARLIMGAATQRRSPVARFEDWFWGQGQGEKPKTISKGQQVSGSSGQQLSSGETYISGPVAAVEGVRLGTTFDEGYLARLRTGDDETVRHFDHYFRRLVRAKLRGKFSRPLEDELVDKTMSAAVQNILQGAPQNAAHLPAYIHGICANFQAMAIRSAASEPLARAHSTIPKSMETPEDRVLERESAEKVKKALATLSRRDRAILVDLFYTDQTREAVCEKHQLTRDQLRMILFRAKKRFQKNWAESRSARST